MKIDIERFLKEHKVLPMSGTAWKECEICHFADLAEARSDTRIEEVREAIGSKVGGVYVYYDGEGECIYIGKAADLAKRFEKHFQRAHRRDKSDKRGKHFRFWSSRPGNLTVRYFEIDREIDRTIVEIMLIDILKPAFDQIPRSRSSNK